MDIIFVNSYEKINERLKNEIRSLTAAGHDVDVVLWQRGNLEQTQRTEDEREQLDMDYLRVDAPFGSWIFLFYLPVFYVKLAWYLFGRDDDIIHCCHLALLPICVVLGKFCGSKVIYDAFEYHAVSFHGNLPDSVKRLVKQRHIEAVENLFVRFTDGVLTIDSADDQLINRYQARNANAKVLYNAISLEDLPDGEVNPALEGQYADRRVVTYVGGIKRSKGILETLRAAEQVREMHPDVLFLFIGTFTDDSRPEAMEIIDEANLDDTVEFINWIPYDRMLKYLEISEVGLAPFRPTRKFTMLARGTNRKQFTYMSAGLPVVAPDFLAVSEHVREHECGECVDTTDPDELASAIIRLLDDPGRATEMGKRGRAAIEDEYNWENEIEDLLEVYRVA